VLTNIQVDAVVFGADRVAANGDTANKIGTYKLVGTTALLRFGQPVQAGRQSVSQIAIRVRH